MQQIANLYYLIGRLGSTPSRSGIDLYGQVARLDRSSTLQDARLNRRAS